MKNFIKIQNYKGYFGQKSIRLWIGERFYLEFEYKKRTI